MLYTKFGAMVPSGLASATRKRKWVSTARLGQNGELSFAVIMLAEVPRSLSEAGENLWTAILFSPL